MPKARPEAADSESRLARVLDEPGLPALVPHLGPETLHRLIRHLGLEACGAVVASATPAQLAAVFDLDLWQPPRPGLDQRFDADRFASWIEMLVESDAGQAARIVAGLDADLVVAGLSRHVRVFDVAALHPPSMDDLEASADPGPDVSSHQIGGYEVRARGTEVPDAIVCLLTALAGDHAEVFHAVMRGCRRLSDSAPEIDGLDALLSVPDQLLHDIAVLRDDRRATRGYLTPADARAFLAAARRFRPTPPGIANPASPIASAFLRSVDAAFPVEVPGLAPGAPPEAAEAARTVVELLDEADFEAARPRALLAAPEGEPSPVMPIRRLMEHLRDRDPNAYSARSRELAFLANALVSGSSLQSRTPTPREGMDAAIATCNLGLELDGIPPADAFLADHDLMTPFDRGWTLLFEEVTTFVSRALLRVLGELEPSDSATGSALRDLGRELAKHCAAETPWRVCDALEVLATLDVTVWASLLSLLDECPVIPSAMTAVLDRRTGPVSATDFAFISTRAQIDAVHAFVADLPERLRG